MFADTQPAELDAVGSLDPWSPFRVRPVEARLHLLRMLRDRALPVMLHSPGCTAVTTAIWSLDPVQRRLSFSTHADATRLAQLVEADDVVALAYDDAVKLQFPVHGLMLVRSAAANALQCTWPDELYRFQRRSAYRVRPPEHQVPLAHLHHPSDPERVLALRIIDLCIGGCALWLPADEPPLQAGTPLGQIHLELGPETRFTAAATLHHVTPMAGKPGAPTGGGMRLGCEWRLLDGSAERALQRWIDQAQRRSRLLSLG